MRMPLALNVMVRNPGYVFHRKGCLEYWRYDSETKMIQCKYGEDGEWSSDVVISHRDLTEQWELSAENRMDDLEAPYISAPYVSPKNNSVETHAACVEEESKPHRTPWERLAVVERAIQLLDSRISGHVKVTDRRLKSQDDQIGNHIECQERNARCQDRRIEELELAINKISTVLRQHEAWFNKEDYKNE